jgi:signal transduction histidine kinase/ActR/RegA family two-component response regulator
MTQSANPLSWRSQAPTVRIYVAAVAVLGWSALMALLPHASPRPLLFAVLLAASCLTSIWKVNLPLGLSSGSTLSVSYAANLLALLLLGPRHAIAIGAAGAWTQCTWKVRRSYPLYRTLFSVGAEILAMTASGAVYRALGGPIGTLDPALIPEPLVGAMAAYFLVNTGLVAGAIALSTGRGVATVWRRDFLWSAASFIVAGTAGAVAAVIVASGRQWLALLMLAPVYLAFRTYRVFVGRLDDEQRHIEEMQRLHGETLQALEQAQAAEQALAKESGQLADALAEMRQLQEVRDELLAQAQLARASAEQANRLKDQFLAIVSHELRTPLNAVLGWGEMLQQGLLDDAKRSRAIHAIVDGARRQSQLIEDLLDIARIMSGKLRLSRSPVDVREIVTGAIELVQPASDAKGIRLTVDVAPSIPPIDADGARLQQIVWNLLSNAIKFTPGGGTVGLRLKAVDDAIEIAITDTGPGIAADFLGSVFEPFRQADATSTRAHSGLGLGLAIVKHLVDAHGGTVRAESAGAGCGATFTVWLPAIAAAGARPPAPTDPPSCDDRISLADLRVLVVDDDRDNRTMVQASLESHHAIVLTAASTPDALDLLARERIDVVLTDIAMPGEDGYALIAKIRASNDPATASIPVIALTASARSEDRYLALRAGFQLHLPKPVGPDDLTAAIVSLGKLHVA